MHYNLMEAATMINNIYSVQFFIWIIFFSSLTVYQIFSLLETIKHSQTSIFGFNVISILVNCSALFIIALSCHSTSQKVSQFIATGSFYDIVTHEKLYDDYFFRRIESHKIFSQPFR